MAGNNQADGMIVDTQWRLDKRIPVALVMAIMIQSAGIIIWAAHLDGRVSNLEQNTVSNVKLLESNSSTAVSFAHLNDKMDNLEKNITSLATEISSVKDDVRKIGK